MWCSAEQDVCPVPCGRTSPAQLHKSVSEALTLHSAQDTFIFWVLMKIKQCSEKLTPAPTNLLIQIMFFQLQSELSLPDSLTLFYGFLLMKLIYFG